MAEATQSYYPLFLPISHLMFVSESFKCILDLFYAAHSAVGDFYVGTKRECIVSRTLV